MRCYWTETKDGPLRVPRCWGAVIHWGDEDHGAYFCTCYNTPQKRRKASVVKKLKRQVAHLKKMNAELCAR